MVDGAGGETTIFYQRGVCARRLANLMGLFRNDLPKPAVWPPPREPERVAAALRFVRMHDPIGHQVHTLLALAYLVMLPLATAPKDIAYAALVLYAVLRVPHTWRCYAPLLRNGLLWAWLAWAAWTSISLAWSSNPAEGAREDLGAMRVWFVPLALWPILDRGPWLIASVLIGVVGQHMVQMGQWFGWLGLTPDEDSRLRGLIHPIQAGAFFVAAMCWHVSGSMRGRGWFVRAISILGLAAAGAGLFATGSRGPWIAGATVVPLTVIVTMIRRPGTRRMGAVLIVLGVVAAAVAWPMARDMIEDRVSDALSEAEAAGEERLYTTSVGLRLAQWRWAWEMFCDEPLTGIGAGSFRDAQQQVPEWQAAVAKQPGKLDYLDRGHSHSTYLHALASTGAVGGLLFALVLVLILRQAWRDPPDHVYADGPLFVVIGWLVAASFDCYQLNGHTFGLLAVAAAVTMPGRARARTSLRAADPDDDRAIAFDHTRRIDH